MKKSSKTDPMAWFSEAGFGLFIHWGLYAVPAGEWKTGEVSQHPYGEWIMYHLKIPVRQYEKLAGELGLENMVNFHGLKPKKEVAEFMRNCDFFILPSFFETFGIVLIEALACGNFFTT